MNQRKIYEMIVDAEEKNELQRVLAVNEKTSQFGVALTNEDAELLVQGRRDVLKMERRVEFGESILPELIMIFCDSVYMEQSNYAQTLYELQEVFYLYKNEAQDQLTDNELLTLMKELFEGICYGSVEYMKDTCLERFARAVRAGYRDYAKNGMEGEYEKYSEEQRWDPQLYLAALYEELS